MITLADKHYYRAVIFYYLADSYGNALQEIYLALENDDAHRGALDFAKHFKDTAYLATTQEKISEESQSMLSFLEQNEYEAFLIGLLSHDITGNFLLSQVVWDAFIYLWQDSVKATERVWALILKKVWDEALLFWQKELEGVQGNVSAYFQIGYIFCCKKRFYDAEPYFMLLTCFGGIYRLAGIRLLLELPEHKFKTILDFSEILQTENSPHKFEVARILQKSWDAKGFQKIMNLLEKRASTSDDYIHLGQIYMDDSNLACAVVCLRKAYIKNPQKIKEIVNIVSSPHIVKEKDTLIFLKSLLKDTKNREDLLFLGTAFRESLPSYALQVYEKLYAIQTARTQEVLLGLAAVFYSMGDYEKASAWMEESSCFAKSPTFFAMKAKIAFRRGNTKDAIEILTRGIETYGDSSELTKALQEIDSNCCSRCFHVKDVEACEICGYRPSRMFNFEDGKIRWSGAKYRFPIGWIIVTTSSQVYPINQAVQVILFSSVYAQAFLVYSLQGKTYQEKKVMVSPGISMIMENPFPIGTYAITIRTEKEISNTHFFCVSEESGLKMQIVQDEEEKGRRRLAISVFDFLGFPYNGKLKARIHDGLNEYSSTIETLDGCFEITGNFLRKDAMATLDIGDSFGRKGGMVLPHGVPLAYNDLVQDITEYQIRQEKNGISSNVEPCFSIEQWHGDNMIVKFSSPCQEAMVAIQPLGEGKMDVGRFLNMKSGDTGTMPLSTFVNAFYAGGTKFYPEKNYQNVGLENYGLVFSSPLTLAVQLPNALIPEETFEMALETNAPCQAFILFCSKQSPYYPFTMYLRDILIKALQQNAMQNTDNRQNTGDRQSDDCSANDSSNKRLEAEKERKSYPLAIVEQGIYQENFLQIQTIQVSGYAKIYWVAPQKPGNYRFIILLTNGNLFAERAVSVEVRSTSHVNARLPKAIGAKDAIEVRIDYQTEKETTLSIVSNLISILYSQKVQQNGCVLLPLSQPDEWTIRLESDPPSSTRCAITPLERIQLRKSAIRCLSHPARWAEGKATLYPDKIQLASQIANDLLQDSYQSSETYTAQLYCAARLFQFCFREKSPHAQYWERQISQRGAKVLELAKIFATGRWGHWPGYKPDKKITEEVLHHLSPFLSMPRFENLQKIAQKTLEAALSWKIRSNRLFPIADGFCERSFSYLEDAACALKYGIQTEKALRFLEKKWKACDPISSRLVRSLGGEQECLALIAQGYARYDTNIAKDILSGRLPLYNGILSSPASTVALVELLMDMETMPDSAAILNDGQKNWTVQKMEEIESPFFMAQGELWCTKTSYEEKDVVSSCQTSKIDVRQETRGTIQVGSEFFIHIKLAKVSLPITTLLIPPNICVIQENKAIEGHFLWPYPQNDFKLFCKAIRKGHGILYILWEERYKKGLVYSYPHSVVVDK